MKLRITLFGLALLLSGNYIISAAQENKNDAVNKGSYEHWDDLDAELAELGIPLSSSLRILEGKSNQEIMDHLSNNWSLNDLAIAKAYERLRFDLIIDIGKAMCGKLPEKKEGRHATAEQDDISYKAGLLLLMLQPPILHAALSKVEQAYLSYTGIKNPARRPKAPIAKPEPNWSLGSFLGWFTGGKKS